MQSGKQGVNILPAKKHIGREAGGENKCWAYGIDGG